MKQVWILNHYAQEPRGPGGTRHYHLAKYLRQYGWVATIIAASVELNTGRQRLQEGETIRFEEIESVPFLWVRTPSYKGNGAGRLTNMLAYTAKVLIPSATRRLPAPDVVIGSSVHPFAAWAGAILAKRHNVPFVFEVRDLWPQTLIDLGRISEQSLAAKLMRTLEKWLYKRASSILTLLPKADEYITSLGIPKDKIVWIPNGVDLALYSSTQPATTPNRPFQLMYFGAHGQANGLDCLIEAMYLIQRNKAALPIQLRMVGNGPLKSTLIERAKELGLSNITFEESVPKEQIPQLASEADAYVITVLNLPRLYKYGISMNKLYDYLAGGRPIIIASDAANNPVEEAKAGVTVPPANPQALADAIVSIARLSSEERVSLGKAGYAHVAANYDFPILAGRLASVLESSMSK